MDGQECCLLSVPAEIRMLIYEYLFDSQNHERILIRSAGPGKCPKSEQRLRKRYYVLDRSFQRRCYETTYRLADHEVEFCAAFMRVNHQIYSETSPLIYGRHSFDFGADIEAVEPFLTDLTPGSRELIGEISLYKRGPIPLYENDRSEWRSVCKFLQKTGTVKKLRLVVQGGKPSDPWEGPKEFTAADFKLLADIKHDSLQWVKELSAIEGIEELEIIPDIHYCQPPTSSSMIIFAAFSASIDKGLAEFLRSQLRLL